jgi:3-phenylpropionate/trans-cinnamate dioxygenase ferredoxin subunit
MADFIEAGLVNELTEGKMNEVLIQGQNILLALIGGKYYAAQGRCPHMGGILAHGKLEGTVVTCPRHKSKFDLKDGKVLRWMKGTGLMAAIGKILKHPRNLKTYEVKVENGNIFVKI